MDPVTGKIIDIGIVLTYIVPTKQSGKLLWNKKVACLSAQILITYVPLCTYRAIFRSPLMLEG